MQKIMFNDKYGLTQAVLEGRKTMTRRIAFSGDVKSPIYGFLTEGTDAGKLVLCDKGFIVAKSSYRFGEVVAIAQQYCEIMPYLADSFYKPAGGFMEEKPGYHNKMYVRADLMPHQIRITNVRVERLRDISDEDCLREGIYKDNPRHGFYFNGYAFELSQDQDGDILASRWFKTPREAFAALIDKISGKGTWESNPYEFVYEFELVK